MSTNVMRPVWLGSIVLLFGTMISGCGRSQRDSAEAKSSRSLREPENSPQVVSSNVQREDAAHGAGLFDEVVSSNLAPRDLNHWFSRLLAARRANDKAWQDFVESVLNDPQASVDLFSKLANLPWAGDLYELVATIASERSPDLVRRWIASAPEGTKARIAAGLIRAWARTDAVQAAAWLESDRVLSQDKYCAAVLVESWFATDRAAAAQWAGSRPDWTVRKTAVQTLGRTWGMADPSAAKAHVTSIEQPAERDELNIGIAEGWAQWTPDDAVAWFVATPLADETRRTDVMYGLISDLASVDPKKAEYRVEQLTPGPVRDAAISGLVDTVFITRPDLAVEWVLRIQDAETRAAAIDTLRDELAERAPALAESLAGSAAAGSGAPPFVRRIRAWNGR